MRAPRHPPEHAFYGPWVAAKRVQRGRNLVPGGSGGAKTYVFLGHPSCAQARAAEGEAFSEKDEALRVYAWERFVQPGSRRPLPLQPFWGQRLRQRDLRAPGGASEHAFCVLHATRRSTHITVFLGAPNQTRGRGLLRKCAVEKLEHTFFYVFLYGSFAGIVRLAPWRRIHRPVRRIHRPVVDHLAP